jgi:hypothetical protein
MARAKPLACTFARRAETVLNSAELPRYNVIDELRLAGA